MWLINEVDTLNFELECVIDNLWAVHGNMEEDQGANWEKTNNAVFSVYLQLKAIHDQIQAAIDTTIERQKSGGPEQKRNVAKTDGN